MQILFIGYVMIIIGCCLMFIGVSTELGKKYEVPPGKVIVVFNKDTFDGRNATFFDGLTVGIDGKPIKVWGTIEADK